MAKQTFTTGQVLTAAQMTSLQQTAMGGGSTTAKTTSYVLVAADAGTVVQMNAAGATTITVNTALFAAGDTVQIQNVGAGVCTITAGTATVNTSATLALKQYDGGTLYFNSASAAIFFSSDAADSTSPLTTKGDVYTFSTVDARLPVGANNTVLTADSTAATGLKWAAAGVNQSYSLINSGGTALTAASTITVSGISGMNALKILVIDASTAAGNAALYIRFNTDSGANYDFAGPQFSATTTYSKDNFTNYSTTGFTRIEAGTMSTVGASKIGAYCEMTGCNSTGFKSFTYAGAGTPSTGNGQQTTWGGGIYKGTSTISSVSVITSDATNFDAGTIYVYGSA